MHQRRPRCSLLQQPVLRAYPAALTLILALCSHSFALTPRDAPRAEVAASGTSANDAAADEPSHAGEAEMTHSRVSRAARARHQSQEPDEPAEEKDDEEPRMKASEQGAIHRPRQQNEEDKPGLDEADAAQRKEKRGSRHVQKAAEAEVDDNPEKNKEKEDKSEMESSSDSRRERGSSTSRAKQEKVELKDAGDSEREREPDREKQLRKPETTKRRKKREEGRQPIPAKREEDHVKKASHPQPPPQRSTRQHLPAQSPNSKKESVSREIIDSEDEGWPDPGHYYAIAYNAKGGEFDNATKEEIYRSERDRTDHYRDYLMDKPSPPLPTETPSSAPGRHSASALLAAWCSLLMFSRFSVALC